MEAQLDLTSQPYHDGSDYCLLISRNEASTIATVKLLDPDGNPSTQARVRVSSQGEIRYFDGTKHCLSKGEQWWAFSFPLFSRFANYRFELRDGNRCRYVSAGGLFLYEPVDHFDFKIRLDLEAPQWARDSFFYQIFIDRFCRSGIVDRPSFEPCRWSAPVETDWPASVKQFYGGDLYGIEQKLSYLENLGVNAIALTPFFPSKESHRYSAINFNTVDLNCGGDHGLITLKNSCDEHGIRCIGDLTLNHCGRDHSWFQAALSSAQSPERDLFYFSDGHYDTFMGVAELPKLNYENEITHKLMYEFPDSVVKRWLSPPVSLDGWRIDVASMVGRNKLFDGNRRIAKGVRKAIQEVREEPFIVGEYPGDPACDIATDGWGAAVLDAGFASPIRDWCSAATDECAPRLDGRGLLSLLQSFWAASGWEAIVSSIGFVGNHDFPRLRSITSTREHAALALFLLSTLPPIPMLFYGDELGLEGRSSDASRVPMPWTENGARGDEFIMSVTRELIRLRTSSYTLRHGGHRWLSAGKDFISFERRSDRSRLLCAAFRKPGDFILPAPVKISEISRVFSRDVSLNINDSEIHANVHAPAGSCIIDIYV